jgi:photosystem II stability/assembly factor-like uncharacterized protein
MKRLTPPALALSVLAAASLLIAACGTASASRALPDHVQPTSIDVGITPDGDRFLLVGTLEHGTFVSFNDGEEWTQSEGLPGTAIVNWIEPAVIDIEIASDGSTAFAATATGLYRSDDSGRSWTQLGEQADGTSEFIVAWDVSAHPRYGETPIVAAIVDGRNYGDSALVSDDGGESWGSLRSSNPEDIQVLEDSRVGVATYRNLSVYPALAGQPGMQLYEANGVTRASFSPNFARDHIVIVGGSYAGDPFCPLDAVTGSCEPSSGLKLRAPLWRDNLGIAFSGTRLGAQPEFALPAADAIQVAHVPGRLRTNPLSVRPTYGVGPHAHSEVVLSPGFAADGIGIAITWDGLARTTDFGKSWLVLDLPTPDDEPLQSVAFSPDFADSSLVYAVTQRRLLKSTDGGTTWQAFPSLDELPPIPTNTPEPTATPRLTPLPTATAAPSGPR